MNIFEVMNGELLTNETVDGRGVRPSSQLLRDLMQWTVEAVRREERPQIWSS